MTLPANLEAPYVTVKEEDTTPRSVLERPSSPCKPVEEEGKEGREGGKGEGGREGESVGGKLRKCTN
jgi:hypothetical protein